MEHPALSEVFAGTCWADGKHAAALSRLPDTFVPKRPIILQRGDSGATDVVVVPLCLLRELQFAAGRAEYASLQRKLRWWWPRRR
jgi:hypothetical protein